jgi:NADH-quinone oxidoreductase subunit F
MSDFDLTPLKIALSDQGLQGRSALLPALHKAQSIYGYLPEPVAAEIGRQLGISLADVYGVIEFYTLFYTEQVGDTIIRVCTDPACAMRGGENVLEKLYEHLNISAGEVSENGRFSVERAPCLGLCDRAPAILVNEAALGEANTKDIKQVLNWKGHRYRPVVGGSARRITSSIWADKPIRLIAYEKSGGYSGLKKAFKQSPEEVIREVKASGLVGRGGAAFPTGIKWEGAAAMYGETKLIVCNGDESEPGTFKDRVLLEGNPHCVLEGLAIAAYAIGAEIGYIFIRGEYPYAYKVMGEAVAEAKAAGYLGQNILDTDINFNVELRLGAGAYICGEETALFEAIEGKRGLPRLRPPYPTTSGLFGKPTVINNVETLCNVPYIIHNGAVEYRALGTENSPGTKLFCLSGDVVYPGLYEAPFGITLRELIFDLAGGLKGGELQAILIGGAAGAFVGPEGLDISLSYEGVKEVGIGLGSGAITVINEGHDLRQILLGISRFFAHESCGKCYPCQLGTQRQYEIIERASNGSLLQGDLQRLTDVGWTMSDASICGLGQTAASAVRSALERWPQLFDRSIE